MKTVEEELALLARKREADKKAQARRRERLKEQGMVLKQIWVKESDPNQTDLAKNNNEFLEKEIEKKTEELNEMVERFCIADENLLTIAKIINAIRAKNKGTVILARQKELAEALQQIEEILR